MLHLLRKNSKHSKKKIINIIEIIKKKYSEDSFKKIFDSKIESQIIPVFSRKKINSNEKENLLGLLKSKTITLGFDELFLKIFEYFNSQKINYDSLFDEDDDEQEIEKLMKKYSLLNAFKSKNNFLNIMKEKMKSDANNLFLKYLILNPESLKKISKETIIKIFDYVFDNFIIIYKFLVDKLNEEEKMKIYKLSKISRVNDDEIRGIFERLQLDKNIREPIDIIKIINSPTISLLSDKLSSLITEEFMNLIKDKYFVYFFTETIRELNRGILDLFILGTYYQNLLAENIYGKN